MSRSLWLIGPVAAAASMFLVACDSGRIAKLEKDNQELRARIATSDLDLQAQCSRDASAYFAQHWGKEDARTILLNYGVHYSRKQGKCFIEVNYTFRAVALPGDEITSATITVQDIYGGENIAGAFVYESKTSGDNTKLPTNKVVTCATRGSESNCKSQEEFQRALAKFYGD